MYFLFRLSHTVTVRVSLFLIITTSFLKIYGYLLLCSVFDAQKSMAAFLLPCTILKYYPRKNTLTKHVHLFHLVILLDNYFHIRYTLLIPILRVSQIKPSEPLFSYRWLFSCATKQQYLR